MRAGDKLKPIVGSVYFPVLQCHFAVRVYDKPGVEDFVREAVNLLPAGKFQAHEMRIGSQSLL
jgi:hypothetical protein